MKIIVPVLFIFAFFGCQQPFDEEAICQAVESVIEEQEEEEPETPAAEPTEEPTAEPEAEEEPIEPEPTWTAEARHIYLYPESVEPDGTNYAKLYIADEGTDYNWLYNAAKSVMESHNQDYPEEPWIIIGGGP